jgi:hypothetical protein
VGEAEAELDALGISSVAGLEELVEFRLEDLCMSAREGSFEGLLVELQFLETTNLPCLDLFVLISVP